MVGYTGGSGRDPTYENMQDFAEGIRVEFNEAHIVRGLLGAYLALHTGAHVAHGHAVPVRRILPHARAEGGTSGSKRRAVDGVIG